MGYEKSHIDMIDRSPFEPGVSLEHITFDVSEGAERYRGLGLD
ncbi:hypothetical protein P12x_003997 [Tundrisphaera lichenicola]